VAVVMSPILLTGAGRGHRCREAFLHRFDIGGVLLQEVNIRERDTVPVLPPERSFDYGKTVLSCSRIESLPKRSITTSRKGDGCFANSAPSVPRTYRSRNARVYADMISKPRDASMTVPIMIQHDAFRELAP